ncbi:MAG: threonine synthase [Pseudomonadota bacterium]
MKYKSTRGGAHGLTFTDSLLMGLAPDGGLLVPEEIPDVSMHLETWRGLDFVSLAKEVIGLFVDDIDTQTLNGLIDEAYASFDHPDVVGTTQLGNVRVLELFHGPTLAFKDVALQLLGKLFEHVLEVRGLKLNILGATSGDTGSAAIAGVRGQKNVDIYILYPDNKISDLQELQMTTVCDDNVHCIAVDGSFDDCQTLMKTLFGDLAFKERHQLGAINSVNWARVMAQIVYYGYASLSSPSSADFCVPTGNFGNVFAAYLAKRMGFPINKLLVATNANDILTRFFKTGVYTRGEVHFTLSPAMDIQIASNFERYLYYLMDQDSDYLTAFMHQFQTSGTATLAAPPDDGVFDALAVDNDTTLQAISQAWDEFEYILDPHTAVGFAASRDLPGVTLIATAHPAKFPQAIEQAIGRVPTHPSLESLRGLESRKQRIPADLAAVRAIFE